MSLFHLSFLATILTTCHATPPRIHPLRPKSGSAGTELSGLSCQSWRLAVETNNIIGWTTVPHECIGYVGHYMLGQQYREDSKAVAAEASIYAKSLKLAGDGNDIWVFDVDETALSNLPYFAKHGLGGEPYNPSMFNKWVAEGKAPPLPETLKLYKTILKLGIKVVLLTGRSEAQRNATATNLKNVGFKKWEKLILKSWSWRGKKAVEYKSGERGNLEKKGYRIVGNIGDQWSDILGSNVGIRTFKLPDPLYYIT